MGTLAAAVSPISAAQSPQTLLNAGTIPQFAQSLPLLTIGGDGTNGIATFGGIGPVEIHICEFDAKVLPPGTPGVTANTRSWGYVVGTACPASGTPTYTRDSFIGPVFVAIRDMATQLKVVNDLGTAATTGVLAYKYSVDQTLHWADPLNAEAGWKDTVIALPGQVTRVAVRYAPTDLSTKTKKQDLFFPFDPSGNSDGGDRYGFVHHCHMTEHEDNEMMRPNLINLNPDAPAPASRRLYAGLSGECPYRRCIALRYRSSLSDSAPRSQHDMVGGACGWGI